MIDFMIIGAQKAATSALQGVLRQQENIYMPNGESPFFEPPQLERKLWTSFPPSEFNGLSAGIKRPDILCSEEQRQLIAQYQPHAKFIVVLREPVSRAVSAYIHLYKHGHVDHACLNKGLKCALDHHLSGSISIYQRIVENGLYGKHLKQWFDCFGEDAFLVLSNQKIKQDLPSCLNACLDHIGVSGDAPDSSFPPLSSANVGTYHSTALRLSRFGYLMKTCPVDGVDGRRHLSNNPVRLGLGYMAGLLGKAATLFLDNNPPSLDPALRQRFDDTYMPDADLLSSLVGDDVVYWRAGQPD